MSPNRAAVPNETGRTGDPVSLGWQAQYQDPETGLYYLRHRYYDPATAQFTTPDPLYALTGERYGYASNDPINGSDPSGLCGESPNETTVVAPCSDDYCDTWSVRANFRIRGCAPPVANSKRPLPVPVWLCTRTGDDDQVNWQPAWPTFRDSHGAHNYLSWAWRGLRLGTRGAIRAGIEFDPIWIIPNPRYYLPEYFDEPEWREG
jgi:RHS repeat-associated protein